MRKPCLECGRLTPDTYCITCEAKVMAPYRDPAYQRNRQAILAGSPPCVLRILCNGARATTADHILSLARGGTSAISNLQPACGPCNSAKRKGGRER